MLLLASRSPRRRKILRFVGIPFRVLPSQGVLEIRLPHEPVRQFVRRLAKEKAMEVWEKNPGEMVLGADTVVSSRGRIFGKPKNRREALRMLRHLSGRQHEVWTGLALIGPRKGQISLHCEKTEVCFRRLSLRMLRAYVKTSEPYDKAGGYDIQGTACGWVENWKGDYFNVMGLPIRWLVKKLNGQAAIKSPGKF
ncbi:MAG TPA: Maf family protein [bacterium]|nr:Maf family protein [bacterium]